MGEYAVRNMQNAVMEKYFALEYITVYQWKGRERETACVKSMQKRYFKMSDIIWKFQGK